MSREFQIKCYRVEWQICIQQLDQYDMPMEETVIDSFPTRDEAIANLPVYGVRHKHLVDRWIPKDATHGYQRLVVRYKEVLLEHPVRYTLPKEF